MKSPKVMYYLNQVTSSFFNPANFYHELVLESDIIKYLVLKTMKLDYRTVFESLVKTVVNFDPEKRIFKDVLRFYEQQNLEYSHPKEKGYYNLMFYTK